MILDNILEPVSSWALDVALLGTVGQEIPDNISKLALLTLASDNVDLWNLGSSLVQQSWLGEESLDISGQWNLQ